MVSHTADRTTQRQTVRRPGWFGAAIAVGVPAAVALVWFIMAVAHVIVGAVIAVGAAVAWCIWLERHA
jgi:hypothetical protein